MKKGWPDLQWVSLRHVYKRCPQLEQVHNQGVLLDSRPLFKEQVTVVAPGGGGLCTVLCCAPIVPFPRPVGLAHAHSRFGCFLSPQSSCHCSLAGTPTITNYSASWFLRDPTGPRHTALLTGEEFYCFGTCRLVLEFKPIHQEHLCNHAFLASLETVHLSNRTFGSKREFGV